MVVKMMKWRPWPPLQTRKYAVRLRVKRLEGWVNANNDWVHAAVDKEGGGSAAGLAVEIRWKGPRIALSTFRRISGKKNCTKEECVKIKEEAGEVVDGGGPHGNAVVSVEWDEEFQSVCSLSGYKDNVFHPWEVSLAVLSNVSCFVFSFLFFLNFYCFIYLNY